MKEKQILVIIPAYNEGKSLSETIEEVRRDLPEADILVVNDGSLDSTGRVAEEKGVLVINFPYNLGIGVAMQAGYKFAREKGYAVAVQCDADGQHPASEIRNLLKVLEEENLDLVIGSRYLERSKGFKSTLPRRTGINILSKVVSLVTGTLYTDPTSGFRASNQRVINAFSSHYPEDYPEVESLAFSHRANFQIKEIPVEMRERQSGKSSIGFLGSFYYMVKVTLAVLVDLFERNPYRKERKWQEPR